MMDFMLILTILGTLITIFSGIFSIISFFQNRRSVDHQAIRPDPQQGSQPEHISSSYQAIHPDFQQGGQPEHISPSYQAIRPDFQQGSQPEHISPSYQAIRPDFQQGNQLGHISPSHQSIRPDLQQNNQLEHIGPSYYFPTAAHPSYNILDAPTLINGQVDRTRYSPHLMSNNPTLIASYPKMALISLIGHLSLTLGLSILGTSNFPKNLYNIGGGGFFISGLAIIIPLYCYVFLQISKMKAWNWLAGMIVGALISTLLFMPGVGTTVFFLNGPSNTRYPQIKESASTPKYPHITWIAIWGQASILVAYFFIMQQGKDGLPLWKTDFMVSLVIDLAVFYGLTAIYFAVAYGLSQLARIRKRRWFIGLLLGTIASTLIFLPGIAVIVFALWGPTTIDLQKNTGPNSQSVNNDDTAIYHHSAYNAH
jgi:hypothetical protein